mmetsp:Transcript_8036/g.18999  ORF Transcript_8036/g.18999 Transcript_8036/m.18999 type:complete len:304 (+) Transcript_8036:120-1031(+)
MHWRLHSGCKILKAADMSGAEPPQSTTGPHCASARSESLQTIGSTSTTPCDGVAYPCKSQGIRRKPLFTCAKWKNASTTSLRVSSRPSKTNFAAPPAAAISGTDRSSAACPGGSNDVMLELEISMQLGKATEILTGSSCAFMAMKAHDDPVKISVAFPSCIEISSSNMTSLLPPGQAALLLSVPDMAAAGGAAKFVFDGRDETRNDVVDAFFHFAHVNSGFRRMPWDLQGYATPSQGVVLVDPIVWSDSDLADAQCGPVVDCGGSAPDMSAAFRILHPECNRQCISQKLGGQKGLGDFFACTR